MPLINGYVAFWINAFIPRDVRGYTQFITQGTHQGKTAIPLPDKARLNPGNLYKPADTGYLTDQRDFSSESTASVRMQSIARVSLYPPKLVSDQHSTSGTTEVGISSGMTHAKDLADMSDCWTRGVYDITSPDVYGVHSTISPSDLGRYGLPQKITDLLSRLAFQQPSRDMMREYHKIYDMLLPPGAASLSWHPWQAPKVGDSYSMLVKIHGEASDPLVSLAANIDYQVDFVVNVDTAKSRLLVGVFGAIDSFPAFEAYVSFNGFKKTLFQLPPPDGNTVVDLVGAAMSPVAAAVSFP